jgi:hypothetical protein
MDDKIKDVLAGVALLQGGKVIAGEPTDNVVVRPVVGGTHARANGQDVLKILKAAWPLVKFLWLSKPWGPAAAVVVEKVAQAVEKQSKPPVETPAEKPVETPAEKKPRGKKE